MTLVNNYDTSPELYSIDEAVEFFAENNANPDKLLIEVAKKLDKEFEAWIKFTYCAAPNSDEQWEIAEQDFLVENYGTVVGIEKAFKLEWPHKIDAEELV